MDGSLHQLLPLYERARSGQWPLVLATVVINLRSKLNPLWLIAAGALLGVVGWV